MGFLSLSNLSLSNTDNANKGFINNVVGFFSKARNKHRVDQESGQELQLLLEAKLACFKKELEIETMKQFGQLTEKKIQVTHANHVSMNNTLMRCIEDTQAQMNNEAQRIMLKAHLSDEEKTEKLNWIKERYHQHLLKLKSPEHNNLLE